MNHPTLGKSLLAMVRMLVSMKTFCAYCVDINTRLLLDMGFSAESIQAIKKNPEMAPLGEKEKAMLLFVMKSVFDGHAVEKGDIEQLRHLGWTDADILDATAHGAYMMAGDIIYNAFKVEKDII
ncbi:MAG: carboxymuconolactone decarboxylase family protein [Nitrospirae bacterium]|nr:carboxymuconolactone decarboxylase family protein [Nitrospirota bacterium]